MITLKAWLQRQCVRVGGYVAPSSVAGISVALFDLALHCDGVLAIQYDGVLL